jgi:hypothetical protein
MGVLGHLGVKYGILHKVEAFDVVLGKRVESSQDK